MLTRRGLIGWLVTVLIVAIVLAGCANTKQAGEAVSGPPPSVAYPAISVVPIELPSAQPAVETVEPSATPIVLGPLFDASLNLKHGPVEVPIELQISALNVNVPVLGVGLNSKNEMDAPKGAIGAAIWHTAFWYRGSGIPGEPGTATIAGHVNDPLARPEIFAHLEDLQPGDLIVIRYTQLNIDIRFIVDQTKIYSTQESADPAVLTQIFGSGPVSGTGPKPAPDGRSHLTLITCAGNIVKGEFDHHAVVYATRSN